MRRALWLLSLPWLLPACLPDLPPPGSDVCTQDGAAPLPSCAVLPGESGADGCNPLSSEVAACFEDNAPNCDCPCASPAGDVACPPGATSAVPGATCLPSTPTMQAECALCRQASCSAACDGVGVVIGSSGKIKSGYLAPMSVHVDGASLPGAARFGVYVRLRGQGTASFVLKVTGNDKLRYSRPLPAGGAFEDLVLWDEPVGGPAAGAPLKWTGPMGPPPAIDILVGTDESSLVLLEIDCIVPFVIAN